MDWQDTALNTAKAATNNVATALTLINSVKPAYARWLDTEITSPVR